MDTTVPLNRAIHARRLVLSEGALLELYSVVQSSEENAPTDQMLKQLKIRIEVGKVKTVKRIMETLVA